MTRPNPEKPDLISELVEMAWCDKTSFDDIEKTTGYSERDVIALMRRTLKPGSFRLWRKRVSGRPTKHEAKHRTRHKKLMSQSRQMEKMP